MKCFVCDGRGRNYTWSDRDPYEGYKLAEQHKCLFCDAKGLIEKNDPRMPACVAYVKTLGDIEVKRIKKREREEAEKAKLVASAKSKLSAEELEALGVK